MKGPALFQGEIISNSENTLTKFKNFFSRTTEPISTNLGTKHPWVRGIQDSSNEKTINSHTVNNVIFYSLNQSYDIIISVYFFSLSTL